MGVEEELFGPGGVIDRLDKYFGTFDVHVLSVRHWKETAFSWCVACNFDVDGFCWEYEAEGETIIEATIKMLKIVLDERDKG